MRRLLTILLLLITIGTFGKNSQTIKLKWKIAKHEKLKYLTIMSEIDSSSFEMSYENLFKSPFDSIDSFLEESKDYFKKLQTIKILSVIALIK